ncbi:MAG: lipid A deacylase LpxR family protein [Cyclobacteriaceae bacterium]|nr:lipid A deacylase LpxR family protein [Cyclobacteriaceae bacterium]
MRQVKAFIIFLILLSNCPSLKAQSSDEANRNYQHEIFLNVDNDYPFATDKYYTAGQDLYYKFLISSKISFFNNNDSSKTIFSIHYGNKVFTPQNVDTEEFFFMDRPYCGWNFAGASVLNFRNKNAGTLFYVQLGLVGKVSGMGELQQWLHRTIGLYSIYGWDTQIQNEFVVNANVRHTRGFELGKKIEFVSATSVWVGTGSNKITEEITLRLFKFNALRESSYMNANISRKNYSSRKSEFFLFTSLEANYVFSNIFIQGSLFDNPSQFTTSITPWLFAGKIGVQYSGGRISSGFSITHLGRETPNVATFNYATASLAYRF